MNIQNITVEPMTEGFILWRCLHGGPLSLGTLERWPVENPLPWEHYRQRNLPLLLKLTRVYGACAIVARTGEEVVGLLRFYPRVVVDMKGAGHLCLQQDHPYGPADNFFTADFPPVEDISDKTLVVHCLMMGSPQQQENPYQRRGLGSKLVGTLARWAKARGWERIEATAFEDLPIIYEITGSAGLRFWAKLGFILVTRQPHPDLQDSSPFVDTLEEQAKAAGICPERSRDQLLMRLELSQINT